MLPVLSLILFVCGCGRHCNIGGSVAERSACRTPNPAVLGSTPALSTLPGFVSR